MGEVMSLKDWQAALALTESGVSFDALIMAAVVRLRTEGELDPLEAAFPELVSEAIRRFNSNATLDDMVGALPEDKA